MEFAHIMIGNTLTDTVDQSPPSRDLQKQIKVLDELIEHLQYAAKAREKVKEGWIPKQSFWDEFMDVNSTPMGQDIEYGDDAYWHHLHGLWYLVGAYLSEAMSSYDDDSG